MDRAKIPYFVKITSVILERVRLERLEAGDASPERGSESSESRSSAPVSELNR